MIRLGVIILAHGRLDRVAQMARRWGAAGCAVHIHVDASVAADHLAVLGTCGATVSHKVRCRWGQWSIVQATQHAAHQMLRDHPDVTHVLLTSGACLPLRPVSDLLAHIARTPDMDFIESTRVEGVPASVTGLSDERTAFWHPFCWHRQRRLFDLNVALHRRFNLRRPPPKGVTPHIGSQWWCLTRATLMGILTDPNRPALERYYRRTWIPDEGYFQTAARRWARSISGQSLTLALFDAQGKPRVFYDDHAQVLHQSGAFIARKIWPDADVLYRRFPQAGGGFRPDPGEVVRAVAPLAAPPVMQGRYLRTLGLAGPVHVISGAGLLYRDLLPWAQGLGVLVGRRLMAPGGAGPAYDHMSVAQRDADPVSFLRNCCAQSNLSAFLYEAEDHGPLSRRLAYDPNVTVHLISGAWLSLRPDPATAARWQRAELDWIDHLSHAGGRHEIWTLGACLSDPSSPVAALRDALGLPLGCQLPVLRSLPGLSHTLTVLRRAGVGDHVFGPLPMSGVRPALALRRVVGE